MFNFIIRSISSAEWWIVEIFENDKSVHHNIIISCICVKSNTTLRLTQLIIWILKNSHLLYFFSCLASLWVAFHKNQVFSLCCCNICSWCHCTVFGEIIWESFTSWTKLPICTLTQSSWWTVDFSFTWQNRI